MICIECRNESKYKCPVCRQPYCSVICYKQHKETLCSAPPTSIKEIPQPIETEKEYEYPTEDTVPLERLKLLEHSAELKKCLENPYAREILELLDKTPYPDDMLQEYMQEPIFTEFVDACLSVVQPTENNK